MCVVCVYICVVCVYVWCVCVYVCVYQQQGLQPARLPVSEVEEAVSGVMGMQACHTALVHSTRLQKDRGREQEERQG